MDKFLNRLQNNVIIASYLTGKIDDQRNEYVKNNDFQYIKSWWESVKKHNLKGVILHNDLSEEFIQTYTTDKIKFIKCPLIETKISIYYERWLVYYNYILKNKFSNIFLTDTHDIQFNDNPFKILNPKYDIYIGSELIKVKDYPLWKTSMQELYGDSLLNEQLLNSGILGGSYDKVRYFLKLFVDEIKKNINKINYADLIIFNKIAYQYFGSKFLTGFPLHSVFKEYQNDAEVYIVHK